MGEARRATVRPQALRRLARHPAKAPAGPGRIRGPLPRSPGAQSDPVRRRAVGASGLLPPGLPGAGARLRGAGEVERPCSPWRCAACATRSGAAPGSSPPGKSRTSTPREALLLSEPVLVETASVLSSGSPARLPIRQTGCRL